MALVRINVTVDVRRHLIHECRLNWFVPGHNVVPVQSRTSQETPIWTK
jgi:hypothetical protein